MPLAGAESLGALLARVRTAQGRSQLRVAELLCAASGAPTITRHEISRWERDRRIPGSHWLGWLAVVLDVGLDELERAVVVTRALRGGAATAVDTGDGAGRAGPAGPVGRPVTPPVLPHTDGRPTRWPTGWPTWAADVTRLRALDDLVGGVDLAPVVNAALRSVSRGSTAPGGWGSSGRPRRPGRGTPGPSTPGHGELGHLAGLAQLAGWVNADAGDPAAARAAHRLGLRAAGAAGDRVLVGHLLGSAAHLSSSPRRALALARAGAEEVAAGGSATARALLLQRVAYAAVRSGDRAAGERALVAADRMFQRRRVGLAEPWLYWLTDADFAALTGRCQAAAGRHRPAAVLLDRALRAVRQPRSAALYRSWLAEARLGSGDTGSAAELAARALLDAVRAGSVRAAVRAREVHRRLLATGDRAALQDYLRIAAGALGYLPDPAEPGPTALPRSG